MLFHALSWQVFSFSDAGHHAVNLFFHLLNGLLVYRLTLFLFKEKNLSLFAVAIFLLHPLQVESVAWISELKNVLSTTFALSAFINWCLFLKQKSKTRYVLTLVFFALGILSKPALVVFPFSLLAIEWILFSKINLKEQINKIPFLLIAILFAFITYQTQSADLFINHSHEFPYWQRFLFAGYALLMYCVHFIYPFRLCIINPYPDANLLNFSLGILGWLLFLVPFIWSVVRKQFFLSGSIAFVLINFLLVLQFIPFGEVLYADRYTYVPLLGFAWILILFVQKFNLPQISFTLVFTIGLGLLTFIRLNVWSGALKLYEDILVKFPNSFVALNSAGAESMRLDRNEKSLKYFNRSVRVAPNNYKAYYNRGLLYLKNQKPNSAIQNFDRALELYEYYKLFNARATAYLQLGDVAKAMSDANHSLELKSDNPKAHYILGTAYDKLNQTENALNEYNLALELDEDDADLYFKRAIIMGKKQDFISCLNDLNHCILLRPEFAEAYYWRGVAKINLKQNACEDFKVAAQNNLEAAISAYNNYCP